MITKHTSSCCFMHMSKNIFSPSSGTFHQLTSIPCSSSIPCNVMDSFQWLPLLGSSCLAEQVRCHLLTAPVGISCHSGSHQWPHHGNRPGHFCVIIYTPQSSGHIETCLHDQSPHLSCHCSKDFKRPGGGVVARPQD